MFYWLIYAVAAPYWTITIVDPLTYLITLRPFLSRA